MPISNPNTENRKPKTMPRFFCLRGFMKSGTNWVGSLLSLHPEICVVGEFHWQNAYESLSKDLRNLPIASENSNVRRSLRNNFEWMVRQTLIETADPNATVIGDRTPHTFRPIVLRGTPQIGLTRDARDVLISRIFHLYNHPEVSRVFDRFPELQHRLNAFQDDCWFFRDNPNELLCNEELVRESVRWWKEHIHTNRRTIKMHPHIRFLNLRYEDFHSDVLGCCRRMYSFLDVDPDLVSEIPTELQPAMPEERPNEFFRKGQIGDWKNYMTDNAKRWINEECGMELIEQGYIESLDW